MLTIDLIVEKYCSLFSEDGIAANQRRHGFSPADIEKSIKVHRAFIEKIGTAAKLEEKIDRFRSELILLPRDEQIARYLLLFGSFERSSALWTSTFNEPPDVFWAVVLEAWCVCDGLWPTRKIMLSTLKRRAAELSPIGCMSSQDRAFYDQLPGRVSPCSGVAAGDGFAAYHGQQIEKLLNSSRGAADWGGSPIRSLPPPKSQRPIYSSFQYPATKARSYLIPI